MMKSIYPFKMMPLCRIYCGCGCEDYIEIHRYLFGDDEKPEYGFNFVSDNFYDLKHRLKLFLTPKKKFDDSLGLIVRDDQYKDIIAVLRKELGDIPHRKFEFKKDKEGQCLRLLEIKEIEDGDLYGEIYIDSIIDSIDTHQDRCEIDIYPGPASVYKPRGLLSPTFRKSDQIIISKENLMEFAQLLDFYWGD